jgi:hypothetical protein
MATSGRWLGPRVQLAFRDETSVREERAYRRSVTSWSQESCFFLGRDAGFGLDQKSQTNPRLVFFFT